MAIKTIINNTEKEIEQIKNSNEQDIDYVYSRIGDTEVEGEPPISIKSIGGNLTNYRIYGNTAGGESVGDLVESGEHAGEYKVDVTVKGKNFFDGEIEQGGYNGSGLNIDNTLRVRSTNYIPVVGGETYNLHALSKSSLIIHVSYYTKNDYTTQRFGCIDWTQNTVFTTPSNCKYIRFLFRTLQDSVITPDDISNIMLNAGSTPLPYEPYHTPVTTPIYLPEPIKMVGDEAEYIDYAEQKMHRIGADDIDVTLPALSTIKGTNTFSVNTSIQPSNIYIKDGFDYKRVFTATRTIEGESPLNYRSIEDSDSTLKNYRIYGNGENVGDLITEGEHAGEYSVPVTVTNGTNTETTNIYLPEQIKMVGGEAEYVDYAEQKQHRVRKNLLQNTATSQTKNGVTFIVNDDGSIVCNGQASPNNADLVNPNFLLPSGTYILTGCPDGGSDRETYKMLLYVNGAWRTNDMGSGANFTLTETSTVSARIAIYNGYTCNNLTFYPMIRKADIEDDTYEPYIENTDVDVTLPALPTLSGTNTLTVGTEVQPSRVYLKGKLKRTILKRTIYGWHVNPDISDSSNAVTYLEDAIGMTPASMGSTTFDYGSWENAFFMPKPCMLKSNGKVDYYLDPNDYTKKLDGTASDISNPNYDGNAMM